MLHFMVKVGIVFSINQSVSQSRKSEVVGVWKGLKTATLMELLKRCGQVWATCLSTAVHGFSMAEWRFSTLSTLVVCSHNQTFLFFCYFFSLYSGVGYEKD